MQLNANKGRLPSLQWRFKREIIKKRVKSLCRSHPRLWKAAGGCRGEDKVITLLFMPGTNYSRWEYLSSIDSNKTTCSNLLNLPLFHSQTPHSSFLLPRNPFSSASKKQNQKGKEFQKKLEDSIYKLPQKYPGLHEKSYFDVLSVCKYKWYQR